LGARELTKNSWDRGGHGLTIDMQGSGMNFLRAEKFCPSGWMAE
jgi:hypothetical protein